MALDDAVPEGAVLEGSTLGVAVTAVVDAGGAVTVVVAVGVLVPWHAAAATMTATLTNIVGKVRVNIGLL